ncbi:MAG: Fic family protein [Acidobacteriota bacterium]
MKSFEPRFLERHPVPGRLVPTLVLLGEFNGKQALYIQQMPQVLETLRQAAIIQSTESSNRLEGITAPRRRIQDLVLQKTTPRNRSEQEIAGYRDVLSTIHANHEHVNLTPGLLLQFHRDLYRFMDQGGGRWKPVDNEIVESRPDGTRLIRFRPVPAHETPEAMARLHERFGERWRAGEVEKLLLISAYVLDFLCIHPFLDGNGRMARLLSLLLLYQAGYKVGRYISLEKIIEDSRETYYESLYASSQRWHQGRHDPWPWTEYFLGVLVAACREFEGRVGLVTAPRGAKTEMVLEAIRRLPVQFRLVDLEQLCPAVTREMIRVVLKRLRKEGKIHCEGRGRGAVWLKEGNNP